jgi:hypothetical protein
MVSYFSAVKSIAGEFSVPAAAELFSLRMHRPQASYDADGSNRQQRRSQKLIKVQEAAGTAR